ncbi:MAG: HDOD domain-containing protein [Deltaproteobacteria bacterium]|nr:HDOD domain-containing protein [Deltaproteobacteria bacterium]
MTEKNTELSSHCIFFIKQPILDVNRSIWGYELQGGELKDGIYEVFPQQDSASGLSSSTYLGLQEAMERGKQIMVGFDEAGILTGIPHALPPASGVVRVLPGESYDPGLAPALERLRNDGYQTALEFIPGRSIPDALYGLADIVSIDLSLGKPDQSWLVRKTPRPPRMLARGVKTQDQFQSARDLGFALFQGPFFKEPEYVQNRQLGSNEVARLNLLRLLEAEDAEVNVLAEAIRSDVSVSFRLLSYLNSAWFGRKQNIQSIDQAIMLLGWTKLRGWLRALLFVDLAGKEEVPRELAVLSLNRGKFLELLAMKVDYWGFNPNTLFLLGLFSLLDSILGLPMEKVVELLPLEAKLKAALRRDPNNEYRLLFELLESLEDGDWSALEILTQKLFLDLNLIKENFAQARDWAGSFFTQAE